MRTSLLLLLLSGVALVLTASVGNRKIVVTPTSIGCYKDGRKKHDLPKLARVGMVSPSVCLRLCRKLRSRYAGLQRGNRCWCGDSYGRYGAAKASECNVPCSGNPKQKCGGKRRNAVYATGVRLARKPVNRQKRAAALKFAKAKKLLLDKQTYLKRKYKAKQLLLDLRRYRRRINRRKKAYKAYMKGIRKVYKKKLNRKYKAFKRRMARLKFRSMRLQHSIKRKIKRRFNKTSPNLLGYVRQAYAKKNCICLKRRPTRRQKQIIKQIAEQVININPRSLRQFLTIIRRRMGRRRLQRVVRRQSIWHKRKRAIRIRRNIMRRRRKQIRNKQLMRKRKYRHKYGDKRQNKRQAIKQFKQMMKQIQNIHKNVKTIKKHKIIIKQSRKIIKRKKQIYKKLKRSIRKQKKRIQQIKKILHNQRRQKKLKLLTKGNKKKTILQRSKKKLIRRRGRRVIRRRRIVIRRRGRRVIRRRRLVIRRRGRRFMTNRRVLSNRRFFRRRRRTAFTRRRIRMRSNRRVSKRRSVHVGRSNIFSRRLSGISHRRKVRMQKRKIVRKIRSGRRVVRKFVSGLSKEIRLALRLASRKARLIRRRYATAGREFRKKSSSISEKFFGGRNVNRNCKFEREVKKISGVSASSLLVKRKDLFLSLATKVAELKKIDRLTRSKLPAVVKSVKREMKTKLKSMDRRLKQQVGLAKIKLRVKTKKQTTAMRRIFDSIVKQITVIDGGWIYSKPKIISSKPQIVTSNPSASTTVATTSSSGWETMPGKVETSSSGWETLPGKVETSDSGWKEVKN